MARMIIVSRNGRTQVISGWRAWLLGTLGLLLGWAVLLLAASLVIGVSLTIGMIMLLALPALLGVALVAQVLSRRIR